MTASDSLKTLFERYQSERSNAPYLDTIMFEQLIRIFPAILIAQADGHVDTTEIIHLNKLAHYISTRVEGIEESDLKQEIRYLTWNIQTWRKPILNLLKIYVPEKKCGDEILDLMISTASSSTGSLISNILIATSNVNDSNEEATRKASFISDDEKKEILLIAKELNIADQPESYERLKFIIDSDNVTPN